ncbi:hypothetical protein PSTT_10658 [Puccinia striiformis]|uniref:Uncharacterized protein n=1 Tax=Puccinia striiformis TaxID=27350 RepID=A0A2S4V3H6_9BASI|nr:hypothetical protein PSTT_10658 [Puccinia striiformis]
MINVAAQADVENALKAIYACSGSSGITTVKSVGGSNIQVMKEQQQSDCLYIFFIVISPPPKTTVEQPEMTRCYEQLSVNKDDFKK